MPTYSYRCTSCGEAFDIHQSFSDANLTICPSCGGALRKIFSPVGVSFTGSGFYRNDSRAKPERDKAAAGAAGKSSGESTSSETKSSETTSADSKSAKPAPATKEKASASTTGTGSGSGKPATTGTAS
ncbi:MAG TPA: zinc ribbon domain-containing protein [Terrimesophilobacter sp.]|nr:zinc ribbon domain-containing protein [Terrimesophilobacter sp.]